MGDIQRSGTDAFARLLTEAREAAGLSRRELAEQTGLSYPYVSQLETGYRGPSPEAMQRLTDVLGIPVEAMVAAMAEREALPNRPNRPNRPQQRPTEAYKTAPTASPPSSPLATPAGRGWVTNPAWTPHRKRLSASPSAPSEPSVAPPPAQPPLSSPDDVIEVVADVLARLDRLPPQQRLAALSEIQNQVVRTVVAEASTPPANY
jgi:transcriptional regulator with XRE-family HTH domain